MNVVVCTTMVGDLPYFSLSRKINGAYCCKHGYVFKIYNTCQYRGEDLSQHQRLSDILFGKIRNVLHLMKGLSHDDMVLFIDADVCFYSHDLLIEQEIVPLIGDKDILITHTGDGWLWDNSLWINTGVLLIKNTPLAKQILEYWVNEAYHRYVKEREPETEGGVDSRDEFAFNHYVAPVWINHIHVEKESYRMNGKFGQFLRHYWLKDYGATREIEMLKIIERLKL